MRELGCWVASEVADAGCPLVHLVGKLLGTGPGRSGCGKAIVPVLAKEAIKGAGLIENSEVVIAELRTIAIGQPGISGAGASRTDPIGDAIGGQRVMIPRDIASLPHGAAELAADVDPEPTIAPAALGDAAFIEANATAQPFFPLRRLFGQAKPLSLIMMNLFHSLVKLSKVTLYALSAQPQALRDKSRFLTAATAFDDGLGLRFRSYYPHG
jgi:hypothetical protein